MPSLSELPGEVKRSKFIKALARVGFVVDTTGGDGSHYKVTWPKTQKSITIPYNLPKQVLKYVLKEMELHSGITWEEIKRKL